jgi:cytoskeletal protein CcmA (bactofilin family)
MSFFTKPGDPVAPRQESSPTEASLSVVGTGMKVTGDIETTGVVKIDGVIEGSVRGARQVLLGRNGAIHGDVHAEEAILAGTVVGSIVTSQRVEIQSTCSIAGDVQTKSVVVLEGGVINGTVRMDVSVARAATAGAPTRVALALSQ